MFQPLFWAIIRLQQNLRKLYIVVYKINYMYLNFNEMYIIHFINYNVQFPQIQLWPDDGPE